jgi:glucose-1-phosphate thymidylyltransferase
MSIKGILLAGGYGTRLWPMTKLVSKQMLNVYDKPMIFYPLSTLILAGVKDICIVSQDENLEIYKGFLGRGDQLGLNISYQSQNEPTGLPDAINLNKDFIGESSVILALGDNIFYGRDFEEQLKSGVEGLNKGVASILIHKVSNPSDFGVAKILDNKIVELIEKPKKFVSNQAVTGLYFFPNDCINFASDIKPSDRGELEITDLLNFYLKESRLHHIFTGRGTFWTDSGSVGSLNDASNFVRAIQNSQGLVICAPEEVALYKNFITKEQFIKLIENYNSEYAEKLKNTIDYN